MFIFYFLLLSFCRPSILSYDSLLMLCDTERNGRKTLTTVQGLPKKFDQKKILKVIKKKFGMSFTYLPISVVVHLTNLDQLAMAPSLTTRRWER